VQHITEIDDPRLVKGMAHPLRIHILRILQDRTASPSELADKLDAPLGNVSYHVRFLARVGLIELSGTQPRRGAVEHYYKAAGRVRVTDDAWSKVPTIVKDAITSSALEGVGRFIAEAAERGGFHRRETHVGRRELSLDDQGFKEMAAELAQLSDRADEIERASIERQQADHADGRSETADTAGLVLMLFGNSQALPSA
jgi:DNA-binding transcriptional ArsR family regulator